MLFHFIYATTSGWISSKTELGELFHSDVNYFEFLISGILNICVSILFSVIDKVEYCFV